MKRLLNAALLVMIAATVVTAQKEGTIAIRSNVPIKASITNDAPGWMVSFTEVTPVSAKLPIGAYTVTLELPDGTTSERLLTIRKNCTTKLDVTYKPPTCPTCPPLTTTTPAAIPETPKPEPTPVIVPTVAPVRFDVCCGCKSDDLKARLDLFAVELHRNPQARGLIEAPNPRFAADYLVNQRRVDRARLIETPNAVDCTSIWIVP